MRGMAWIIRGAIFSSFTWLLASQSVVPYPSSVPSEALDLGDHRFLKRPRLEPGALITADIAVTTSAQGDASHASPPRYRLVRLIRQAGGESGVPLVSSPAASVHAVAAAAQRWWRRRRLGPYVVEDALGRGSHGEVWRAARACVDDEPVNCASDDGTSFVLKRVFVSSLAARRSGWREVYFGLRLRNAPHIARFVEHFEWCPVAACDEPELWLVFVDEGVSLQALLYAAPPTTTSAAPQSLRLLSPSRFWLRLRRDGSRSGITFLRGLVRQLAAALTAVHTLDPPATHRDVKPGNVLLAPSAHGGRGLEVRLCDFGSAVDEHASTALYGPDGPSAAEETVAYAPPEVVLADSGGSSRDRALTSPAYDAFSVGISLLEVILGAPPATFLAPTPREAAIVRAHVAADVRAARRAAHHQHHHQPDVDVESDAVAATHDVDLASNGSRVAIGSADSHAGGGDHDGRRGARESDDVEAEEEAVQRALFLAGLRRLCVAPSGTIAPDVESSWDGVDDGTHRHASHAHAADAADAAVFRMPCSLEFFRALLRRADAAAQERADGMFGAMESDSADTAAGDYAEALVTTSASNDASYATGSGASGRNDATRKSGGAVTLYESDASAPTPRVSSALVPLQAPDAEADAVFDALVALALPPVPQEAESATSGNRFLPPHDTGDAVRGSTSTAALSRPVALLGEAGEELLWRLLQWEPEERITLAEVAAHPFVADE